MKKIRNLIVIAAVGALAQASPAALTLDLRVAGGGKSATIAAVGDTVNLELYAVVDGTNVSPDEAFQAAHASLLSTGAMLGDFTSGLAVTPFDGSSHQDTNGPTTITPVDLDLDTDLDLGSNNNASASGFFVARANSIQAGTEFLIGQFVWQVDTLGASASINARPRAAAAGALFQQDGATLTGTSGVFQAGTPVTVTPVPEPAALGLAGIAAFGMLRRRRIV